MKIKAVFFDQDETLISPATGLYEEYILQRALDFGRVKGISDIEQAKKQAYKYKNDECEGSSIILYDKIGVGRDIWYDRINQIEVEKYLEPDLRLKQFVKSLRDEDKKLFLLTNSPTLQTKKILRAVGLTGDEFEKLFTWVLGETPPKPTKRPFVEVMEKYGIVAKECVMVGNEVGIDLAPAHKLGIWTIGINLDAEKDENVDFVAENLSQVKQIINQIEINE